MICRLYLFIELIFPLDQFCYFDFSILCTLKDKVYIINEPNQDKTTREKWIHLLLF